MVLVKILKRKDASSVIVAIVAASVITQYLSTILLEPASWVSGSHTKFGFNNDGFGSSYIFPTVLFVLEFIGFELLVRLYLAIAKILNKKG